MSRNRHETDLRTRTPGPVRRVAEAALSRSLGLPAATGGYRVTRGLRTPMRNGPRPPTNFQARPLNVDAPRWSCRLRPHRP